MCESKVRVRLVVTERGYLLVEIRFEVVNLFRVGAVNEIPAFVSNMPQIQQEVTYL